MGPLLGELLKRCEDYVHVTLGVKKDFWPWPWHPKCSREAKEDLFPQLAYLVAREAEAQRRQALECIPSTVSSSCGSGQSGASTQLGQPAMPSKTSIKVEELHTDAPRPREVVRSPFPYVESREHTLSLLLALVPRVMMYVDPFVGGGTQFLQVLVEVDAGRVVVSEGFSVSDKNAAVMNFWQQLQSRPDELVIAIVKLRDAYNALQPVSAQDMSRPQPAKAPKGSDAQRLLYKSWVEQFRLSTLDVDNAALLVVLQHTNRLGLYRENKTKGYNVTWGKGWLCHVDLDNLRRVGNLIKKHSVKFTTCSFEKALVSIPPGSFVYLDPPRMGRYNSYLHPRFSLSKHKQIEKLCKTALVGSHYIMSNSDHVWVKRDSLRRSMVLSHWSTKTLSTQGTQQRRWWSF